MFTAKYRHAKTHASRVRLFTFSVNSRISARAEIISRIFFRAATHNFYARFLQEIFNKLQLIATRQPVQA